MKFIIIILFFIFSLSAQSQNVTSAKTEQLNIAISSSLDLSNFLHQKFNLLVQNIDLELTHKIESLTGTHYTFAIKKAETRLASTYIKAHVNKYGKLFYLQYNITANQKFELVENEISLKRILSRLDKSTQIDVIEEIFVPNSLGKWQKVYVITMYNEANDFYVERKYFSETDFIETDLKIHFAPKDTTINAMVFLPDPLTSSENEYGGDYQDAFRKDTMALVIKSFPNTGQTSLDSDSSFYILYGDTFNVQTIAAQNTFSKPTIYFVFENIYLDVNGQILGYNTTFVDDTSVYKTQLITEDYDYTALNNERVAVEVTGDFSGGVFSLKNAVFEIDDFSLPIVPVHTATNNHFGFKRSASAFEETNAFYHLNNFHGYIESLGFENLDPEKLKVDVHGAFGGDNSFFTNAPSPRLVFGDGGVDDAEDADVIIHEYVHGLSFFASPNTNDSTERRALDEALGDYFASSYSASYSDFNVENIFTWDGHNEFWDGRITNSEKTYEDYKEGNSIYSNGAIWSATLMDVFNVLGKEITDKLVLESLYYSTSDSKFSDAANILLLIDSVLYNKAYQCEIYTVLVNRKFKIGKCIGTKLVENTGLIALNTEGFTNHDGIATFYVVEENFEKLDYWVTDAIGRVVEKRKNVLEEKIKLDALNFVDGVYYLRIQTKNNKYKTKLVKH